MTSKQVSASHMKLADRASMLILLVLLLFFFFKDQLSFDTQRWVFLILGIGLVIIDSFRVYYAYHHKNQRLLLWRVFSLLVVFGVTLYWFILYFI